MRKTAYFDCFNGAAGDMIVGALLDAGLDLEALRAELGKLDLSGYAISAERVRRGGMAGTKFHVQVEPGDQPQRGLSQVEAIIGSGELPGRSAVKAGKIFRRLAEAEAKVHGIGLGEVHFHEVGAVDSIVDIVAAAVGLELLGVEEVLCSPIPAGSGWVEAAHGRLPVPAPATAELLVGAAIAEPIAEGPTGELTTPTAAAILTTLSSGFGAAAMTLDAVGCGAGTRDDGPMPNLLRVLIGRCGDEGEVDTAVELSANLDDCTGEVVGAAIEKLLAAGALDAWAAPITMKKSRPGWLLAALCLPADVGRVEDLLFVETTTFGVRRRMVRRSKLTRRHQTVETPYGPVRMKVGSRSGRDLTASPEFADAQAAAEANGAAVRDVLAAAVVAWRGRGR
ncbi:MAG: nickel pincer cofactor biosynthesis protein LarC [Planctomycetota bacterium]|jgi:uncharacterized protein (TIGR00299 family) protein